jgi:hypothetical protein
VRVVSTDPKSNLLAVEKPDGLQVAYDPSRLRGISAYREIEWEFAVGDRIGFTAPNPELGVANRDLGTIQQIGNNGEMTVRMDGSNNRIVTFSADEMRHFDHGYAVTSHCSRGFTSERVLVNIDTNVHTSQAPRPQRHRGSHAHIRALKCCYLFLIPIHADVVQNRWMLVDITRLEKRKVGYPVIGKIPDQLHEVAVMSGAVLLHLPKILAQTYVGNALRAYGIGPQNEIVHAHSLS